MSTCGYLLPILGVFRDGGSSARSRYRFWTLVFVGWAACSPGVAAVPQVEAAEPSATQLDIPVAYRGHWSLDAKFCDEPGPANVWIAAREVRFYERTGFLALGRLNHADEPASFHGYFTFNELLNFGQGTLRLRLDGRQLVISQTASASEPESPARWARCPA